MTEAATATNDQVSEATSDKDRTEEKQTAIKAAMEDVLHQIESIVPLVNEAQRDLERTKSEAKAAKEVYDLRLARQHSLCQELADIRNGKFQPLLPFREEPADDGATHPIESLGLTEKESEVLISHGFKTVGDLEKAMREDEQWYRNIKGFGEAKITKLQDAHLAFRQANPMPSEDDKESEGGDE